ncbi:DNA-3-methyladenine glycosylase [Paraburkholderia sp. NMBU_R16]|uniref:DNA-3-methyladenine glycosylase n=1 Tax=Paraburkholderia sp. NMBU_R16 TaxID=2698676 RepID=UPI001564FA25|nr:DNA-3-methyladenine glycosylase [Paraburkholderia sp. NMBU_R16]NRO95955.1 DNA-3-methyladenine glycosylase [Paraburkholderia sp. NMBU_R16]
MQTNDRFLDAPQPAHEVCAPSAAIAAVTRLEREELPVDTVALARFMVGKYLVHDSREGRVSGRIVETEAYPVGDSTSHAYRGQRPYNGTLFRAPGHAYVRLVYGASYMINMSSEVEGVGAAVLLRAVEPIEGIALMQVRRPGARHVDLARGPGRLTAAFAIGPEWDGADLCGGAALWIGRDAGASPDDVGSQRVAATKRIGLSREMHALLRFYECGSPFVSGPKRLLAT